jgi:hypothetical protein
MIGDVCGGIQAEELTKTKGAQTSRRRRIIRGSVIDKERENV